MCHSAHHQGDWTMSQTYQTLHQIEDDAISRIMYAQNRPSENFGQAVYIGLEPAPTNRNTIQIKPELVRVLAVIFAMDISAR